MKPKKKEFEKFYCSPEELAELHKAATSNSAASDANTDLDKDERYYVNLDEMVITRGISPAKAMGNAALLKSLHNK